MGAGGLGSPALMYLAAAGVGTLGIVEFDTVDESNLQRQVIHGAVRHRPAQGRVGGATRSARSTRSSTWSSTTRRWTTTTCMEIFAQYDLIVDGTDNFATRYMVNDAAVLLGKPYVWGSIYRFDGQAQRVLGRARPVLPLPLPGAAAARHGAVLRRGRRARRAVRVSIGSIQVTEAIKLLTGIGEPLVGRLMVYDALEMELPQDQGAQGPGLRALRREPDASPSCIDYDDFCGAVSDEAAARRRSARRSPPPSSRTGRTPASRSTWSTCGSPPSTRSCGSRAPGWCPRARSSPARRCRRLPQDRQIVLYCKTGVRCAEALAAVKAAGFKDAVHVQGGVVSWVNTVDPSLPSY